MEEEGGVVKADTRLGYQGTRLACGTLPKQTGKERKET